MARSWEREGPGTSIDAGEGSKVRTRRGDVNVIAESFSLDFAGGGEAGWRLHGGGPARPGATHPGRIGGS
jgi:hypothetical protein